MMDWRNVFLSRQNRAITGAVGIHVATIALLLMWRAVPLPAQQEPIRVELVDIPVIELPRRPEIVTEPELEAEDEPLPTETEVLRADAPAPDVPELAEPAPFVPEIVEPAPIADALAPSGPSLAQEVDKVPEQLASDALEAQGEAPGIEKDAVPPEFVYVFDPFAETAPTALARVSKAINCARVNRETRPAFCPNYDENDLFLASLAANRPSEWDQVAYDPVQDAAVALDTLGRFSARQSKFGPNGRSEIGRTDFQNVVIPDEDCAAIGFGFENTVPGQPGHAVNIPDAKAVYCR